MTKQEIHARLVSPICALEEYVSVSGGCSPIVDTITIALRHILNEIEDDMYNDRAKEKK